jgi:hypothetical protein
VPEIPFLKATPGQSSQPGKMSCNLTPPGFTSEEKNKAQGGISEPK